MPRYTVFYAKRLPNPMEVPDVFVEADYLDMGEREARDLEHLFGQLQDPKDQVFVDRCMAHLIHTSMSPGDVAVDEQGRRWACDFMDWKELV